MDYLAAFAVAIALAIGLSLLFAWPAMLLFGVVHSFLPIIPAFGFGQTLAIMLLLHLILPGGGARASSD